MITCENTNTTDKCLEVDGFTVGSTGGGCMALIKTITIEDKEIEFLLTDDDLNYPATFPLEASVHVFINGESIDIDGIIAQDRDDISTFVDNMTDFYSKENQEFLRNNA